MAGVLVAVAAPLTAGIVVFSNWGSPTPYGGLGYLIGTAGEPPVTQWVAQSFSPSVTTPLGEIQLYFDNPLGADIEIDLRDDSSGLPGPTIESQTLSAAAGFYLLTTVSVARPVLYAGTQYWVSVEFVDQVNNYGGWSMTSDFSRTTGTAARWVDVGWTLLSLDTGWSEPNLQVEGTGVPEPGALLPVGAALIGLAVLCQRRRYCVQ
jgi:hypothetical protein